MGRNSTRQYVIYIIKNIINNKVYIGSTNDFKGREKDHFNHEQISGCIRLRRATIKYGKESFIISILEDLTTLCKNKSKIEIRKILLDKEQYYLDNILKAQEYIRKENKFFIDNSYNINPIAGSRLGSKESNISHKQQAVLEYDLEGNFIRRFESCTSCCKFHKITNASLSRHLNNNLYSSNYHKGARRKVKSIFKKEDKIKSIVLKNSKRDYSLSCKPVKSISLLTNEEKLFKSVNEAANYFNINCSLISNVIAGRHSHTHNIKFIKC